MQQSENQHQELQLLFTNISKGIKSFGSISEFNTQISSALAKNSKKNDVVNVVVSCVCNRFDVSPITLRNNHAGETIAYARAICFCILHFELGLSMRNICKAVLETENKSHATVYKDIKRFRTLNENLSSDRQFKKDYDSAWDAVKVKIKDSKTI
jgi:chromosomal replication initiation ATPase DnaA